MTAILGLILEQSSARHVVRIELPRYVLYLQHAFTSELGAVVLI